MTTDAQKRASAKYAKLNVKQKRIAFYPAENDLYEWLCKQENQQGYIKALIRKDMEAKNGSQND